MFRFYNSRIVYDVLLNNVLIFNYAFDIFILLYTCFYVFKLF